ncbi:MAG TPA: NlpC/P60 family protein [Mycobacteriales bacterium]|nr:NlpC/P60 family protein [Mycobacteriales bacterium]
MPHAVRIRHLMRVGILTALSATILATATGTGFAAADDTTPPPSSSGSSQDQTPPTDPGTSDPSGTTSDTSAGASTAASPTITFETPRAAMTAHAAHMRSVRARHTLEVRAVLREAQRQRGKPYSYGGSGPRAFDCSGLVRFVFGHAVGRWLPHNAAAQYHVVQHIKRRDLQPGDLVFQESGGYPFHVGIYAGHGKWWHAPHTGTTVRKQAIYHGHKYYGRVLTYGFANHHMNRGRANHHGRHRA